MVTGRARAQRIAELRAVPQLAIDWVHGTRKFAYPANGSAAERYRDGDSAPVVLLPGVYETWHFMKPIAESLHRLGHPVHVVEALGKNVAPVADAAALAARYITDHDLRDVVLVGHSKGGLIGKHLMLVDDTDARIDRLIAIASPFSGSSRARFFVNRPLRAFVPTEATLVMLAKNAEANARITSIYGSIDAHIPEGSELPGATNIEVPIVGHFRLLSDDRVIRAIAEAAEKPS